MAEEDALHILFLPFLAPSHIIALVDMARLFAERPGVRVSLVNNPGNSFLFRRTVDESARRGHPMDLLLIPFPSAEVGLPEVYESTSSFLPVQPYLSYFFEGINRLRGPLQQLIRDRLFDCIVSDVAYLWTTDLGIPRVVFEASSPFQFCIFRSLADAVLTSSKGGDDDSSAVVVAGGLPHRIEMMRSELTMQLKYPKFLQSFLEAESKSYGVVVNCFYELTPEYVDHYCELLGQGRRLWCLGPVWLCNRSDADQIRRGGSSDRDSWERIKRRWLDSQDQGSVLYVCFGSEFSVLSHDQLREIALGLESLGHRFLWMVKDDENTRKAEWLPKGFEESMKSEGKGVIWRGWAPQLQALNHPAIGGFLTHCGWNSTVEAVSAGVPMVAWPLQWEQFMNERMIVEVLGIGIRVLEGAERTGGVEKETVKAEAVNGPVSRLMGGGEEAKAMRKRAEEYKVMASRGEQSSVITEITDRKPKTESEPNRTVLVRSGFGFGFQNPNRTEPNRISLQNLITMKS